MAVTARTGYPPMKSWAAGSSSSAGRLSSDAPFSRRSVAFEDRLQAKLRPGAHVGRHVDGQAERQIPGLRDEESVRTFRNPDLRHATPVGEGSVRVHHHTSAAEGRLSCL